MKGVLKRSQLDVVEWFAYLNKARQSSLKEMNEKTREGGQSSADDEFFIEFPSKIGSSFTGMPSRKVLWREKWKEISPPRPFR